MRLMKKEMKDNIEILQDRLRAKDKVIVDLLDRITNLEFDIEGVNNILNEIEKFLLTKYEEWKDSEIDHELGMECMYIYNYIQELKGSDKE